MAVPDGQVEWRGCGSSVVSTQLQELWAAGDQEVDSVQVSILCGQVQGGLMFGITDHSISMALNATRQQQQKDRKREKK